MNTIAEKIDKVEGLRDLYVAICESNQLVESVHQWAGIDNNDVYRKNCRNYYNNWYNASCALFGEYLDEDYEPFCNFREVDNSGDISSLQKNYNKIVQHYHYLINKLRNNSMRRRIGFNVNNES
jgi:hypothetical protein